MLRLLWSMLFLLFAVFGSAVGFALMVGMPVAGEVQGAVIALAVAVAAVGVAAFAFPPFPTFRTNDPVPPYFPGTNRRFE